MKRKGFFTQWLEDWSMRDLENSVGRDFARPYEDLNPPPSEAELLHYINFKLGHTNALLGKIHYWLQFLGVGVIIAVCAFVAKQNGWL